MSSLAEQREGALDEVRVTLSTGVLDLRTADATEIGRYCGFAARANPKRGFLIVSKVLGRHIPARPKDMRRSMEQLASLIPSDVPGPVLFVGMAETATALGQGVFEAFRRSSVVPSAYLQTSRQKARNSKLLGSFEEGHSHATTHLIQTDNELIEQLCLAAGTLVIVDDECSTGNTFVEAGFALAKGLPSLQQIVVCSLTDWSGGAFVSQMPHPTLAVSLLEGKLSWKSAAAHADYELAATTNRPGKAPRSGMRSRLGVFEEERGWRLPASTYAGERVLVLGEGEHSYEALLYAEEVERGGGLAAVQCITRSPALLGHSLKTKTNYTDAYGSGAPCFLYNLLEHEPHRIVILSEVGSPTVVEETTAGLLEFGATLPVQLVRVSYERQGTPS